MSIASSLGPIIYTDTARGDTKAHMLTDFGAAFTSAGWAATAIAGGFLYDLASPQGLTCKVKVWDNGADAHLRVQFFSSDELLAGAIHQLTAVASRVYQVHVNCCQLFVSVPGVSEDATGDVNAMCGGIPFVAGECDGPIETTDAWWSCGQSGGASISFRNAYSQPASWSSCHNGDLLNNNLVVYPAIALLRLAPVTLAVNTDFFFPSPASVPRTRLFGGEPLYLQPLIMWGSSAGGQAYIRGQLYDAMMPTIDRAIDLQEDLFGVSWVNYMHDNSANNRTRFSALYLILGAAPRPTRRGPYAY